MPEAIQAENLRETLKFIVNEILESFCDSEKEHGIEISLDQDAMEVALSVIAPAGLNSISRRSVTTSGEEVSTSQTSEKVSVDTEETFTTSQEAAAFSAVSVSTKVDPETRTTRTSPFKTSRAVVESTPDVSVTAETTSNTQNSTRTSFGQNIVERVNQYDTV